jgi:hypothetical protein
MKPTQALFPVEVGQTQQHRTVNVRGLLLKISLMVLPLLLGACTQLGPRALSSGRPQYNVAVQETESQQLLMNIVRQRYSDPVLFLDVTSISSGYYREASAGVGGTFSSGSNTGVGSLGGRVSESPLITYAPNNGEKFVRQMLTPLDLSTVAMVVQAGWSIERVLLIVGASINHLRNTTAGISGQSGFSEFQQVVSAMRDLQRAGQISAGTAPAADKDGVVRLSLLIAPEALQSPAYLTICEFIELECDGRPLILRQAIGISSDGQTMALATRSLFTAMYFLAQGVDVPVADAAAGFASSSDFSGDGLFGPPGSGETLFHVQSSPEEPENAAVKIFYRDKWFYIADSDTDSKVTFALISMLVMLQSGETSTVIPLITVPAR